MFSDLHKVSAELAQLDAATKKCLSFKEKAAEAGAKFEIAASGPGPGAALRVQIPAAAVPAVLDLLTDAINGRMHHLICEVRQLVEFAEAQANQDDKKVN